MRVGDIIKSGISSTGFIKIVGSNVDGNSFVRESQWDFIVVEHNPLKPDEYKPSVKVSKKDLGVTGSLDTVLN